MDYTTFSTDILTCYSPNEDGTMKNRYIEAFYNLGYFELESKRDVREWLKNEKEYNELNLAHKIFG